MHYRTCFGSYAAVIVLARLWNWRFWKRVSRRLERRLERSGWCTWPSLVSIPELSSTSKVLPLQHLASYIYLSIYLSIYTSIHPSIYSSIYLSICIWSKPIELPILSTNDQTIPGIVLLFPQHVDGPKGFAAGLVVATTIWVTGMPEVTFIEE